MGRVCSAEDTIRRREEAHYRMLRETEIFVLNMYLHAEEA